MFRVNAAPQRSSCSQISVGQAVKAGDTLLILEAMKMQNEIAAPSDGTVKSISVSAGQSVKVRDQLVVLG